MIRFPFRIIWLLLLMFALSLGACNPRAPGPDVPPALELPTAGKFGTIRFGTFSTPNASSMAWLMALERLKQKGYTVETTIFAGADLTIDALTRGDVDIVGVNVASWAAIPKGAKITSIVAHNANPFSIVASNDISSCADLNGRNFAVGSAGTTNTLLIERYLAQNCESIEPTLVTLTDSQARRAALLAGQVDATTLEIADTQQLSLEAPGRFHTLIEFSKAFPDINFTVAMASRDFIAAHPEIARDYVESIVTVNRTIRENPQTLRDAMAKLLSYTPEQAETTANAYLAANVWDPNGGLSAESVESTVTFLGKNGILPATMRAQDVADLSFLNSVLDEMGRK